MSQYYSKLANGSINIIYPSKYVGIGTTNPDGKLHIYEGNLKFTTATNATIANISFVREASNNGMVIQGFETYLAFNTFGGGAGEIMRLNRADGNVGIGTTSPTSNLQVQGATNGSLFSVRTSSGLVGAIQDSAGYGELILYQAGGGAKAHIQANGISYLLGGNLGIGTNGPVTKLHVSASASGDAANLLLTNTNDTNGDTASIQFSMTDTTSYNKAAIYFERTALQGEGSLHLATSNTGNSTSVTKSDARLTITKDGNVGIGTTSPGGLLHLHSDGGNACGSYLLLKHANNNNTDIIGTIEFANNLGKTACIQAGTTGNCQSGYITFNTELAGTASEAMRIDQNANVGIGSTNPGAILDICGSTDPSGRGLRVKQTSASKSNGVYTFEVDSSSHTSNMSTAGAMKVDVNSGRAFTITGLGCVGIGTTSPASRLHIDSGSIQFDKTNTASGGDFDFIKMGYNGSWSNNANGLAAISVDDGGGIVGRYGITYDNFGKFVITDLYYGGYGASGDVFEAKGDGKIVFNKYGSCTFSGTPTHYLTVDSSGNVIEELISSGTPTGSGTTGYVPKWTGSVALGDSILKSNANNVILGGCTVSSSNVCLHISSSSNSYNPSILFGYWTGAYDSGMWRITSCHTASCTLAIEQVISGAAATNKSVYIDACGRVGVGTTNPSYKMDLYGDLRISNTPETKIVFRETIATDTYADRWTIGNDDAINNGFVISCGANFDTPRLVVLDTGNVGIGATDPGGILELRSSTANCMVFGYSGGTGAGHELKWDSSKIYIHADPTSGYGNSAICLQVDNQNIMTLTSNVGIGSVVPAYPFEVCRDTSGLISRIYNTNANGEGVLIRAGDASCKTRAFQVAATDDTKRFTINSDGTVGIGITNPDHQLHVVDSIATDIKVESTGANLAARFMLKTTTQDWRIGTHALQANNLWIYDGTAAAYRVAISTTGNVGIGTTTPGQRLHVYNDCGATGYKTARFDSNDTANGTRVLITNSGNTSNRGYALVTGGLSGVGPGTDSFSIGYYNANSTYVTQNMLTITCAGNVGIGTTDPGSCRLYVSGDTHIEPNSAYALKLGRIGGAPNIKAAGDGWMIMDSSGAAVSLNHYVNNNVYIGIGGGSVGIGTNSASYKLDIATSNGNGIKLNHSDGWPSIVLATKVSQTCAESLSGHSAIFTTTPSTNGDWPFNTANGEYGALVLQSRDNGNSGIVLRTGTGSGYSNGLVVRESGKVGIGITNPTQTLQVSNSSYLQLKLHSTASAAGVEFIPNSGNAYEIQNYNSNFFVYDRTQSQYRFLIDSAGKVGIGTNGPDYKLDVRDSTIATRIVIRNDNNAAAGAGIYLRTFNGATQVSNSTIRTNNSGSLGIFTGTTSESERFTINSSGYVGIGTTDPGTYLHVSASSAPGSIFAKIQNASSGDAWMQLVGGTSWQIGTTSNGLEFYNDDTTNYRVTIKNDGSVGIGTRTPDAKLDVAAGSVRLDAGYNLEWGGGYNGGGPTIWGHSAGKLRFAPSGNSGGIVMELTDSNSYIDSNVGIGTTSPGSLLHVHSTGTCATFTNIAHFRSGPDENATGSEIFIGHQGNSRGLIIQGGRGGEGAIADDNAVAHFCLNRSGGTIPSSTQDHIMTFRQGGFVGIGTTEPGTNTGKLFVGTPPTTGSAAIAQFGGFVRGNFFITHDSASGIHPNTTCTGQVGNSANVYQCAHICKIIAYGGICPSDDGNRPLGGSTYRWSNVHTVCTTTGAIFESNLCTCDIGNCPKGSVVVWRDGKLQGTTQEYDHRVMGITAPDSDSPIVMGAEPILVTGDIEEGDPIVTSSIINHGMKGDRSCDLHGRVIGEALESGSGDSYTIMGMVRKF